MVDPRTLLKKFDPDEMWEAHKKAVTFAWDSKRSPALIFDASLSGENPGPTHFALAQKKGWLFWTPAIRARADMIKSGMVLGRLIWDHLGFPVVSFWDGNPEKIKECLKALLKVGLITDKFWVVLGGGRVQTVPEVLSGKEAAESTWSPEAMAKVHLLPSDQKKSAMKQLGLNTAGKVRGAPPGTKWWAPQSESFSFRQFLQNR